MVEEHLTLPALDLSPLIAGPIWLADLQCVGPVSDATA